MSDTRLSSSLRSVRQGLDPDSRRAALVERMRYRPWAPTVCERCATYQQPGRIEWSSADPPYEWTVPCPRCAGTGNPLMARLHLAAYCGDEAARTVAGLPADGLFDSSGVWCDGAGHDVEPAHRSPPVLSDWVQGLSRWSDLHESAPGWVLVRAQAAAARAVVAAYHEKGRPLGLEPLRALEAAEDWLDDPSDQARPLAVVEWAQAWGEGWPGGPHANLWLPILPNWADGQWSPPLQPADAIGRAAQLAGEARVRAAIADSLRSWALGEDGGQSS